MKQDQDSIRKHNRKMILNIIRNQCPISRSDISRITKMSPTSISRIVGELCEEGWVIETDTSSNGVGRKAVILDINPGAVYCVGVELEQDYMKMALLDFKANMIANKLVNFSEEECKPETIAEFISMTLEAMIEESLIDRKKLIGVGISLPGVVDSSHGVAVFSSQLGWRNIRFAELVKRRTGIATVMENDLKVIALAEHFNGGARESKLTALITFGSGVGSVLVNKGKIFEGGNNRAGEIGHTTIDPTGVLCQCGRRGCLQTYIADWALVQEAQKFARIHSVEDIVAAARNQEAWAQNVLKRAAVYMAITVSNILCMYNPSIVILCGDLIEIYPEFFELTKNQCMDIVWEPYRNTYQLCISELKGLSKVIGAAMMALNQNADLHS